MFTRCELPPKSRDPTCYMDYRWFHAWLHKYLFAFRYIFLWNILQIFIELCRSDRNWSFTWLQYSVLQCIHFALDDVDCAPVSGTSFTHNLMVMSKSSFTEITWSNVILDFFCTFLDLLWYWNLYDLQCFIWNFKFPIRRTMV